jgi:DHA1 family bicyclomycin/chloramphenicol resistance-like MFS transporter
MSPPLPSVALPPLVAKRALSSGVAVLILSALLGIQPITTDLYLPALPALTEGFGASVSQAQLTLSALLLAFGLSQLIWGPLSDRFGRRPILLLGLASYTGAAIGSAMATSMDLLIAWRILQGAAMGAGVMCARAIIRDLYTPVESARVMSRALSGLGLVACLSAPLGGLVSDLFDWRIALLMPALFGAVSLGLIVWRFEETVRQKNPRALEPVTLLRTWWTIASNPTFMAYSALSAASYGGLFTYLASSSFVLIKVLGFGKTQYGLLMFSVSFSYLLGTFICRRMLPRFGVRRSVAIASGLSLASGTAMGVFALAGWSSGAHGGWFIVLPFCLFMVAHGVHQPCGQSGAVGPFPFAAGAASASNGFLMMLAAFAMGGWLGSHMDGTVLPLTNGIWFWTVLIALAGWTLVQKHGQPGHVAGSEG